MAKKCRNFAFTESTGYWPFLAYNSINHQRNSIFHANFARIHIYSRFFIIKEVFVAKKIKFLPGNFPHTQAWRRFLLDFLQFIKNYYVIINSEELMILFRYRDADSEYTKHTKHNRI